MTTVEPHHIDLTVDSIISRTTAPASHKIPMGGLRSGGLGSASSGLGVMPQNFYFTDFTWGKFFLYLIAAVYVISVGIIATIEPWMNLPCDNPEGKKIQYPNPVYQGGKQCLDVRYLVLLGLTRNECGFGRRLVASVLLGGLIGWERRQADRPAGIRTMSLVSLGSCLFTITSAFAFLNGPMGWDASRVSAAIPSGVGFLGAGLIFKKEEKTEDGDSNHVVHGLTTAASLWLSAAVGIACGGGLYMPASFGVACMLLLLRFGPRHLEDENGERDDEDTLDDYTGRTSKMVGDDHDDDDDPERGLLPHTEAQGKQVSTYDSMNRVSFADETQPLEGSSRGSIRNATEQRRSIRKRAALGSIV